MTQSMIHKAMLALTPAILLLSAAAPFAQSQEAAGERSARQDLEEIIVSATRTTRSDKAIPNKVTRIDAEEIALQTPLTLVSFGSNEIKVIALAMILWVTSILSVEGGKLETENKQFV